MDDESRDVSLRLSRTLEKVGVSERMRQLRRETYIRKEIQDTIVNNITGRPYSMYRFGSSIEGTTTPAMNSDHDLVICDELYPVIDHIQHTPTGRHAWLAVSDEHTHPGYVKLQLVAANGNPRTIHNFDITHDHNLGYDNKGRVCYKHYSGIKSINTERNGPADTAHETGHTETDLVYAVRSRTFPRTAVDSFLECTRLGWLTMTEVEEMIRYGCLYVGVGHPASDEKEFEWRTSFSLQERNIMFKLNSTQHQCYVLLKCIKNMLTSEPDIGKSVTSYHCKTCLFRVINKTRADQWIPENLISCTFQCLTELLQCLRNGKCPNFFIRANNMFEQRMYGKVRERLIHHLSDMINEGFPIFYRIELSHIGKALRGHVTRYIDTEMEMSLSRTIFDIYRSDCLAHGAIINTLGVHLNKYTKEETTRYLDRQLRYLSSVNTITEHTQDETKAATRELEPILHKIYAAHLASLALSTEVYESKHRLFQASANNFKHVMSHDLMSGRLVYASVLYRQGHMVACCDLLERLEQRLHEVVMTVCGCYPLQAYTTYHELMLLLSRNPDPQSMLKSSVALCTIFLPSHTEIIPTALQYELYRSMGTPHGSCNVRLYDWFAMVVVDCKVYIFFLQYLVNSNLNRLAARRLATDNLLKQLLQDRNLGHRETGYNLLGWIYSQEGQIEAAVYCFLQSWRVRPHHNAAKWHMLNLIYRHCVAVQ